MIGAQAGISVGTDNLAAVKDADIILVCVKPQVVNEVMEQIRPNISSQATHHFGGRFGSTPARSKRRWISKWPSSAPCPTRPASSGSE